MRTAPPGPQRIVVRARKIFDLGLEFSGRMNASTVAQDGDQTDEMLLEAWRAGDKRAGSLLYNHHGPPLLRFFATKVPPEDAKVLLQETFLACTTAKDRFRGESSVKTYLYSIAHYKLLDFYKASQRHEGDTPLEDVSVSRLVASGPGMSTAYFNDQRRRSLVKALQELPLNLQIIVELSLFERLPMREVAEILKLNENTATSRKRLALKQLREGVERIEGSGERLRSTPGDLEDWVAVVREAIERMLGQDEED
jgi:RNA polymerase sigma factor (sigma-70 family)